MKAFKTLTFFFFICHFSFAQSIVDSLEWAMAVQDRGLSHLQIETDSDDQIYLAGVYDNCQDCYIMIDNEMIYQDGDDKQKIFLAKLDPDGNLITSLLFGGNEHAYLSAFEMDHDDQLILYLFSHGKLTFSNTVLYKEYNLLKIDQNFELTWHLNVDGSKHNIAYGQLRGLNEQMAIDESNDIIIGGSIPLLYNLDIILDTIIINTGGMIMSKFSPEGDMIWELDPTQSANRNGGELVFDNSGNLIQTGVYNGDFIIGDNTLESTSNHWEQFILKFRNQTADIVTHAVDIPKPIDGSIKISPNPPDAEIILQVNELKVLNLKLFDINGRMLWQDRQAFDQDRRLDFGFLSSGMYLLQLTTPAGFVSKKLVIN